MTINARLRKTIINSGALISFVAVPSYGAICEYIVDSQWDSGFVAKILITNDDLITIKNWSVSWQYSGPNKFLNGWNAEFSSGATYSASNLSWNKNISPGKTVEFGIVGDLGGGVPEIPTLTGNICDSISGPSPIPTSTPKPSPTPTNTPTPTPIPTNTPTPTPVPTSTPGQSFYDLPNDWNVDDIEDQSCNVSDLKNVENVYVETASKLFVWLTGTHEQALFEPIGEVANYFGFAALRSEMRDRLGNLSDEQFRGTVYKEILELLDNSQRAILYDLLAEHRDAIDKFFDNRIAFVNELWDLKHNQPLDFDVATNLLIDIGENEGEITVITAQHYAKLFETLTGEQKRYLNDIRSGVISTQDMQNSTLAYADEANKQYNALSDYEKLLMTEVASKVISWYTGSLADSVFLPGGKIGNFFGFAHYRYVDRENVSRSGAAKLVDSVLNSSQQKILCGLSTNVVDYTNDYIDGRAELITRLDPMKTNPNLSVNNFIEDYAQLAGGGEGRRAVVEALTFHLIESMMTPAQLQEIQTLR